MKFIKGKYLNQMIDQGMNNSESQESRKDQTTVITENMDGGDRANIFSYKSGTIKRPCSAINVSYLNKKVVGASKTDNYIDKSPGYKSREMVQTKGSTAVS